MLNHPSVRRHCEGIYKYSFHSYRRFYATCLGQAGASVLHIQSMCRWLSEEAVEIYNVMSIDEQIAHVNAAYSSAPASITPVILAQLATTQLDDYELYNAWCEISQVDQNIDTATIGL